MPGLRFADSIYLRKEGVVVLYLIHLKEKGKDLLQSMKKKLFIIGILLLSMSTIRTEKYALIIAIGDYPAKGGWPRRGHPVHRRYHLSPVDRVLRNGCIQSLPSQLLLSMH